MLDPSKVRRRREAKGWTQADLALKLGVLRPVVSKIETDPDYDPSLSTVEKIAAAFGCGIAMILSPGGIEDRKAVIAGMEIARGRPKPSETAK